jgi:hypothetical protein
MKRFLETIKLSLTSKAFYQRVIDGTEPFGFKYVFFINAISSLVIALCLIPFVLLLRSDQLHQKIVSYVPAELTVTFSHGKISINQPEPYFIKNISSSRAELAESIKKCGADADCLKINTPPENAVVFDSKNTFSQKKYEEYKTAIWVTNDSIIAKKANGVIEVVPVPKNLELTVNRGWVGSTLNQYSWIPIFIPILAFLFFLIVGYGFFLLKCIGYACVAWFVMKINGKDRGYKKAYSVALYGVTFFVVIDLLSLLLPFLRIGLVRIVIFTVFLHYMFKKARTIVPEEVSAHPDNTLVSHIPNNDTNNGTV